MKYTVLFDRGPTSVGAQVPDLPGCFAVGDTLDDARELIREAIAAHVGYLRETGQPVPEPTSSIEQLEVAV